MKTRKEYDSLGQVKVPVDKYWGASTERSKRYFNIGDILINPITPISVHFWTINSTFFGFIIENTHVNFILRGWKCLLILLNDF